jgi:hypothetical protein
VAQAFSLQDGKIVGPSRRLPEEPGEQPTAKPDERLAEGAETPSKPPAPGRGKPGKGQVTPEDLKGTPFESYIPFLFPDYRKD